METSVLIQENQIIHDPDSNKYAALIDLSYGDNDVYRETICGNTAFKLSDGQENFVTLNTQGQTTTIEVNPTSNDQIGDY